MNASPRIAPSPEAAAPLAKPFDDRLMLALFSLLFSLLAATLSGYIFGTESLSIQLPTLFRTMDSNYLIDDFYVNAETGFGIRFYYDRLLAAFGEFIPIPLLFASLHLAVYVAVTAVTAFAARDITGSAVVGVIAAGLAASLQPFNLGTVATVAIYPIPISLAMPFALIALWRGLKGEALQASAASVPAILMHPVFGAEVGVIALLAAGARHMLLPRRKGAIKGIGGGELSSAALILIGAVVLLWIIPTLSVGAFALSDQEYFHISAHFRNSHHLTPSTWPISDFLVSGAFLFAVLFALVGFIRPAPFHDGERSSNERKTEGITLTVALAAAIAALFAGWVLVDVAPTQLGVLAQFFRLVRIVAWIGWILIAWSIADMLVRKDWRWAALTLASATAAPALLLCTASVFTASRFRRGSAMRSPLFFGVVALAVIVALDLATPTRSTLLHDVWQIGLAFGVASVVALRPRLARAALGALLCALLLAIAVFALDRSGALPQIPRVSAYIRFIQPALTIDEYANREAGQPSTQLALAAKQATELDAVFLIPWDWRNWRIFAERAVVVDRKLFPFDRNVMREWRRRYLTIYDPDAGAGYPYDVTKSELLALQAQYGFQYAVLHGDSFSFPVIAEADDWILVRVVEDAP